jgi:hypothetical protein
LQSSSHNGDNVQTLIDHLANEGYEINRDPNDWHNGSPTKPGLHINDIYNVLKDNGYKDNNLTEGEVSIPLDAIEKLVVKRAVKANVPVPKKDVNNDYHGLYGVGVPVGGYFLHLASPSYKRFIAENSSKSSSVLSEYCSGTNWGSKEMVKRRYTHTLNGSARYTKNLGRYVGRWGTRFLGPIGAGLLTYDAVTLMYHYRREIDFGLEERTRLIESGLMPPR